MHILYVDDSGSVGDSTQRYFVLGGVAVFERGIYHLIKAADDCVSRFGLGEIDEIELHGTDMYGGRGKPWSQVKSRADRERMIQEAIGTITRPNGAVRLFSVAVDKAGVSPNDAVAFAFEELCNRFNLFLERIKARTREDQRGLIVMDESKHERPLQSLARNFRVNGGRWGAFRHLAEVPLFVDSKATRIIQLADLVAWSTFRRYEFEDGRFFNPLIQRFDQDGGVLHGLYHAQGPKPESCYCPACMSRARAKASRREHDTGANTSF